VTELREKIGESRLRWYGHVKRMEVKELVRWAIERKEQGVGVNQENDGWIVFGMGERWIWTKATTE
jgi:hypothetical protein